MQTESRCAASSTAIDTASTQRVCLPSQRVSQSSQGDAERSRWVTRSGALRV